MAINSKRLKKITSGNIFIGGGINLIYNSYADINPTDVALIADDQLLSLFLSNDIIFNDGTTDYIGQEGFDRFANKRYTDYLYATSAASVKGFNWIPTTQVLTASTLYLTPISSSLQYFTGGTPGQVVRLPDATSLSPGLFYQVVNRGTSSISVLDGSGGSLTTVYPYSIAEIFLQITGSIAGTWVITVFSQGAVPIIKSGTISAVSFTGNPKRYTVSFASPFSDTNYSVQVTGTDNRTFTWQSKTTTGFVVNINTSGLLTGNVDWTATQILQATTPPYSSGTPIGLLLALTYP